MRIGKFNVISPLGNGQFGWVFHVLDPLIGAERATKVIMLDTNTCTAQEFVDAFNEAKILEKCRHKHIVEIKEVDIYEFRGQNLPCITTEYLENGSLQNLIENKFISTQQSCRIIMDVLYGLEHAHDQNIYHRDIKPANILLDNQWRGKLSDFGLGYGLSGQAFDFVGYNSHLPLEVLEHKIQDELSDIYSLGVTFYRLVNNKITLDLPSVDISKFVKMVSREKFPTREYLPHIPDSIIKIINKAMKAGRQKRFQSCLVYRQAIQKVKFAVDWKPKADNSWTGNYKSDSFDTELMKNKKGYSINFKRNDRRISKYCFSNIENKDQAIDFFYETIRQTSLIV